MKWQKKSISENHWLNILEQVIPKLMCFFRIDKISGKHAVFWNSPYVRLWDLIICFAPLWGRSWAGRRGAWTSSGRRCSGSSWSPSACSWCTCSWRRRIDWLVDRWNIDKRLKYIQPLTQPNKNTRAPAYKHTLEHTQKQKYAQFPLYLGQFLQTCLVV